MRISITGFGPFLNNSTNPSGEIARALNGDVLEVSYGKVNAFLEENDGDFFLCLGLHAKATQPRLEARAHNRVNRVTADVYGRIPESETIEGEEKERATTVDIPELFSFLMKKGLPCSISDNPGTYLCNYLYYNALGKTSGNALFIHLPPISEEWPLERMKEFVEAVKSWIEENHP